MRVLSLNTWGGTLWKDLQSWLASSDADVVCLQEVTRTPGLDGWTTFADGARTLPQRADLIADVRQTLPDHQCHFVASDSGPVTAAGRTWDQDFGITTFIHPRVPLIEVASTFVHGSYTRHDNRWGADRPRAAHAIRVVGRDSGMAVTVVQLHGLRDPAGKGDSPARRAQAQRLRDFVCAVRNHGDAVVVCGDLNLLPDSETFQVLADIGLTDLVGHADTRTSRYHKPSRHASYMLVSSLEIVRHFTIVASPEVSDHRPLLLELDLDDGNPLSSDPPMNGEARRAAEAEMSSALRRCGS